MNRDNQPEDDFQQVEGMLRGMQPVQQSTADKDSDFEFAYRCGWAAAEEHLNQERVDESSVGQVALPTEHVSPVELAANNRLASEGAPPKGTAVVFAGGTFAGIAASLIMMTAISMMPRGADSTTRQPTMATRVPVADSNSSGRDEVNLPTPSVPKMQPPQLAVSSPIFGVDEYAAPIRKAQDSAGLSYAARRSWQRTVQGASKRRRPDSRTPSSVMPGSVTSRQPGQRTLGEWLSRPDDLY